MKNTLLGIVAGLVLGFTGAWLLIQRPASTSPDASRPEEPREPSFVQHDTNGGTFLKLDAATQARMGLKTAVLAAAQLRPEVKAYGRVLDPGPLAALVSETATDQAALQASTREFERLKILFAQNQNVSARALEAAEAAVHRDRIQLDSVGPRLLLGWGQAVASQPDLPGFVRTLAVQEASLLRVDVPLNQLLPGTPSRARVAPVAAPDSLVDVELLGAAPSADPQLQGRGFLLLQRTRPLPPGAAVLGWLTVPGDPEAGVTVPRDALLRHEGGVFVYVQTGEETFARKAIELERATDTGWFLRRDLKPQDRVVVVGAQELLSEELKGQGGEE